MEKKLLNIGDRLYRRGRWSDNIPGVIAVERTTTTFAVLSNGARVPRELKPLYGASEGSYTRQSGGGTIYDLESPEILAQLQADENMSLVRFANWKEQPPELIARVAAILREQKAAQPQ